MHVALLEGGRSLEREVSHRTGARVRDALLGLGHTVTSIDADSKLIPSLREAAPDVAFIALHGRDGEDGTVQQLLGLLGIPHTGSDVAAAARTADKAIAKRRLVAAGLPTPDFFVLDGSAVRDLGAVELVPEIGGRLGWPLVVKPAMQGSSLGVRMVTGAEEVPAALLSALSYDTRAIFEQFVPGSDLAVTVIGEESGARALTPVEAIPLREGYDFEARYEIGATRFACPPELDPAQIDSAKQIAVDAFTALGCSGIARVDMIAGEGGEMTILEVDTVPGLTQTSLVPLAAEADGIAFGDLVAKMLELAVSA